MSDNSEYNWPTFANFLVRMMKDGHENKVAAGVVALLKAEGIAPRMAFIWADLYFEKEISANIMSMLGPKKGEVMH